MATMKNEELQDALNRKLNAANQRLQLGRRGEASVVLKPLRP